MIRSVSIQNFRCIRGATIELAPLTVLVGPNASGKSSILRALDTSTGWEPIRDTWQHSGGPSQVMATFDTGDTCRRTAGSYAGRRWAARTCHFDVERLRSENVVAEARQLASDGENVTNVFATLPRKTQELVSGQFCRLTSVFADVDSVPTQGGKHRLRFQDRWNQAVWYTPDEVSDGSMLLLAYLLLQYEESPPELVGIEEPDRGLHPYLLGQLISILRAMSSGAHGGKPVQFLLASHSAELLDHVTPEEVRFVSRDHTTGALQAKRIDTSQPTWSEAFKEYRESLGSVWLSGSVGGVPGG